MTPTGDQRLFWEAFRKSCPMFAIVLIASMGMIGCGGSELALSRSLGHLSYDALPGKAPRPKKPADKLHAAVGRLHDLLDAQGKRALTGKQADASRELRGEVATQLRAVRGGFAKDHAKLD